MLLFGNMMAYGLFWAFPLLLVAFCVGSYWVGSSGGKLVAAKHQRIGKQWTLGRCIVSIFPSLYWRIGFLMLAMSFGMDVLNDPADGDPPLGPIEERLVWRLGISGLTTLFATLAFYNLEQRARREQREIQSMNGACILPGSCLTTLILLAFFISLGPTVLFFALAGIWLWRYALQRVVAAREGAGKNWNFMACLKRVTPGIFPQVCLALFTAYVAASFYRASAVTLRLPVDQVGEMLLGFTIRGSFICLLVAFCVTATLYIYQRDHLEPISESSTDRGGQEHGR